MNEYLDNIRWWHICCISETFRMYDVEKDRSPFAIYDLIPYGIIREANEQTSSWPVMCWAMNYLGFEFDEEKNMFIKK